MMEDECALISSIVETSRQLQAVVYFGAPFSLATKKISNNNNYCSNSGVHTVAVPSIIS